MDDILKTLEPVEARLNPGKFKDPDRTLKGETRAFVPPLGLETLWINTGTICNIECQNCYIESSPSNDRLAFIRVEDVRPFFDEIETLGLQTGQIGLTGGEPFINPQTLFIIGEALTRGFEVLVLTNAMRPMMLPRNQQGLLRINEQFGDRLTLRISLDHYTAELHDQERGAGSFAIALEGLRWLSDNGFKIDIAGRTLWPEDETHERAGYDPLFKAEGLTINANDPTHLMLFPEMDAGRDVPEITVDCWKILGKDPADMMCATSRMVVKRKGAEHPVVLPCTLLTDDPQFDMGASLMAAAKADGGSFCHGAVKLNHPFCAEFCVLGGATCSA